MAAHPYKRVQAQSWWPSQARALRPGWDQAWGQGRNARQQSRLFGRAGGSCSAGNQADPWPGIAGQELGRSAPSRSPPMRTPILGWLCRALPSSRFSYKAAWQPQCAPLAQKACMGAPAKLSARGFPLSMGPGPLASMAAAQLTMTGKGQITLRKEQLPCWCHSRAAAPKLLYR